MTLGQTFSCEAAQPAVARYLQCRSAGQAAAFESVEWACATRCTVSVQSRGRCDPILQHGETCVCILGCHRCGDPRYAFLTEKLSPEQYRTTQGTHR
jgi:hypothetical protein